MPQSKSPITITILETSDLHGSVMPIQYADNSYSEIGLALIATLIRQERRLNPNTILIDNGDLIQGTPLAYYHCKMDNQSCDPMVLCLNQLQYDAAVFGNHEFNYGLNVLGKAVKESEFPWLAANIVEQGTGLPYFGKPYTIKQVEHGITVGILGLTTSYVPNWEAPNHIEGLKFIDVVQAAQQWIKVLREVEKVDIVIVSYHGGLERDLETGEPSELLTGENEVYRICNEVEGIDVLLTGHQHRVLAAELAGVVVIQPGYKGSHVGKVTLELEQKEGSWKIGRKEAQLLSVEGVVADSEIVKVIQTYEQDTQKWLDIPIGEVVGDMRITDPMAVRTQTHAMIEFINQVQMECADVHISNTALFDDIARGFGSQITMRDVVSNYVYTNSLRVIRISGQDIKDALEQSASYFAPYDGEGFKVSEAFLTPKPQHYNYDMWTGVEYRINIARPVGDRVTMLNIHGQPIDLQAEFDVVMNSYRAGGGGNYTMFYGKPVMRDIPTEVSELITNYILEKGTIQATVHPSWQVVYDEDEA
ncbi:Trifunctional nucleotide phosphoesterase protein YfkN precursor [compost metagenome]